jgi:DNA-directed RNA polymerase beta subunit
MSTIASILRQVKRPTNEAPKAVDNPDYVAVGTRGILASTEKLLAVNRGLADTDERDSLQYKRLMTTDQLMRERVKMDADKTRYHLLRRVARFRSLKPMNPGALNSYAEGLLVGHPLSMPLEEINPMHLVEQARRVTHMGPGGLPSDDSVTEESQNIHSSQFGFISGLEGPESGRAGVDSRMAWGTKIGTKNGESHLYQRVFDPKANTHRWVSPVELDGKTLGLPA